MMIFLEFKLDETNSCWDDKISLSDNFILVIINYLFMKGK